MQTCHADMKNKNGKDALLLLRQLKLIIIITITCPAYVI